MGVDDCSHVGFALLLACCKDFLGRPCIGFASDFLSLQLFFELIGFFRLLLGFVGTRKSSTNTAGLEPVSFPLHNCELPSELREFRLMLACGKLENTGGISLGGDDLILVLDSRLKSCDRGALLHGELFVLRNGIRL